MLLRISARQAVILDGKYKGFNPKKPYKIDVTLSKKTKTVSVANKAKFTDYKKKSCKLRKARLGLLTVNAPMQLDMQGLSLTLWMDGEGRIFDDSLLGYGREGGKGLFPGSCSASTRPAVRFRVADMS